MSIENKYGYYVGTINSRNSYQKTEITEQGIIEAKSLQAAKRKTTVKTNSTDWKKRWIKTKYGAIKYRNDGRSKKNLDTEIFFIYIEKIQGLNKILFQGENHENL